MYEVERIRLKKSSGEEYNIRIPNELSSYAYLKAITDLTYKDYDGNCLDLDTPTTYTSQIKLHIINENAFGDIISGFEWHSYPIYDDNNFDTITIFDINIINTPIEDIIDLIGEPTYKDKYNDDIWYTWLPNDVTNYLYHAKLTLIYTKDKELTDIYFINIDEITPTGLEIN